MFIGDSDLSLPDGNEHPLTPLIQFTTGQTVQVANIEINTSLSMWPIMKKSMVSRLSGIILIQYFDIGHGKGPCDGLGGTCKRLAHQAVRSGKVLIQGAEGFYD